ncbi:MAG: hypothetical protein A2513_10560 [Sulfurimonas sp. RIFOXYD12_FULL_33_39]|uniref:DUF2393 family protein n=1 Tax=unclassified Sulfurimonas TaxID=2623549 RepID=UPI0008C2246D|nr:MULTISPECIES: DUF2393 family protein [unclassified Sulfurimonas]OHE07257.1 MAG: hypothetical protein A3G74_00470 [Sulfurimonas sp. RIFCSPLOWO2_12_FULL_34_6]OHE09751.1 MAG: hypothetical protein A2513_10560 [Sulfurimonas sp. RIFOXYD12_FULL_33_39]OHE13741.1 MAG: hypothetical protein A2530_09195 [Sulfurimonas sp. RIFOXYD2_FULL_34_21]DAB27936.1 MAG TPA: hypothetical protein CFH78_05135 [Sulfurimonas sp. UBA10385]
MITLFNYWHYIVLSILLVGLAGGLLVAFKQEDKKLKSQMIVVFLIIFLLMSVFSMFMVDKYTKEVKLYKLENRRMLDLEKIMYSGVVKNEGNHEIGEVTFEIKLVNKNLGTADMKAGSFFSPSGILNFFTGGFGFDRLSKPQQITYEFVVAKNLKPGQSQDFRVYFDYPPYFRSVSDFAKVYAH